MNDLVFFTHPNYRYVFSMYGTLYMFNFQKTYYVSIVLFMLYLTLLTYCNENTLRNLLHVRNFQKSLSYPTPLYIIIYLFHDYFKYFLNQKMVPVVVNWIKSCG